MLNLIQAVEMTKLSYSDKKEKQTPPNQIDQPNILLNFLQLINNIKNLH